MRKINNSKCRNNLGNTSQATFIQRITILSELYMYSKYLYSIGDWLSNFYAISTFDLPLSANIQYHFVLNLQTL
jgi:hypothetical protein